MWPTNEAETIELYKLVQERLGWRIVHLQTAFPDAIIENRNGAQLVAEFEYLARNFREHKHDPAGCDLVICWGHNWPSASLPVWALEDCATGEAALINTLLETRDVALRGALHRVSYLESEAIHLKDKAGHQHLEIIDRQAEALTLKIEVGCLQDRIRRLTEMGQYVWSERWLSYLTFCELGWTTVQKTTTCEHCGGRFIYPGFGERRYCTPSCEAMATPYPGLAARLDAQLNDFFDEEV